MPLPLLAAALPSLISGGFSLLGGLLDNSDEEKAANDKEALRLEREKLAESKYEFGREAGFKGLSYLADQRDAAAKMARQYNLKNAMYDIARRTNANRNTITSTTNTTTTTPTATALNPILSSTTAEPNSPVNIVSPKQTMTGAPTYRGL